MAADIPPTATVGTGSAAADERVLRPNDWRLRVWRMFLATHTEVLRRLERDLSRQADIPLSWYDVLLQLAEADGRRLRMAELAERVLLSRSGLTRLVDRISAAGLVERKPFPGDARGTYCVLTAAGLNRLRAAAPIHLGGVQRYWLSHFTDEELRALDRLLDRLPTSTSPAPEDRG
ncbi:MAG: winged helix-turn-helix transcriptional regulator [Pseudonocardia sp.]|nr:winged helix-turn-helix transcriptional regulator [Pseudonocardia sp.]